MILGLPNEVTEFVCFFFLNYIKSLKMNGNKFPPHDKYVQRAAVDVFTEIHFHFWYTKLLASLKDCFMELVIITNYESDIFSLALHGISYYYKL